MMNQSTSGVNYCSNCQIRLEEEETKEHYKSDFHRYNIKRRLANLPPMSETAFQDKKEKVVN